jgi:hypothetical protein
MGQHIIWDQDPSLWTWDTQRVLTACVWIMRMRARNLMGVSV